MATVTVANLIPRVRRLLNDEPFESTITADPGVTTTVAVADGTDWEEGDILEFSDGEQAKVRSVSANNLTVKRGHNGTTAAAHTASDPTNVILKNPRFFYSDISEALTREVEHLWPYAWKKSTASITPSATTVWYDLASTFIDLIAVNQLYGASSQYVGFYGKPGYPVQTGKHLDTSLVTSGNGVRFPGNKYHPTNTIKAHYRAYITTSDIEDGVMADALVFATVARLVAGEGVVRAGEDLASSGDAGIRPSDKVRLAAYYDELSMQKKRQLRLQLLETIPPMGEWAG